MTIEVNLLGIINYFNGIDVHQTNTNVKINIATYSNKIQEDKKCSDKLSHHLPIPMSKNLAHSKEIKNATPLDTKDLHKAEEKSGFSYQQGVGGNLRNGHV